MKQKLNKIANYLHQLGHTRVANSLRHKTFLEAHMVTQFVNSKIVLKAEQWDKIRNILNEHEEKW